MPFIRFSPIWIIVGYLLGCVFSSHVSVTLYFTDWGTIWPYIWMVAWPLCIIWRFVLPFLIFALIVVLVIAVIIANSDNIRRRITNSKINHFMKGRK